MNILITTGIYPPKIGGPSQYAKSLKIALQKQNHFVTVRTFGVENHLPTGIRHIYFFFKTLPIFLSSKIVFALDTYSVGFPTVLLGKIFRKKVLIRTGGDFLWEQYIERTNKKVLLRDFYNTEKPFFNLKDRIIFAVTKWTLQNSIVVFSTEWQRKIFVTAYGLVSEKTYIVENFYGEKESESSFIEKVFLGSARHLVWKNLDTLKKVFSGITEASLFIDAIDYEQMLKKIKDSYAIVLVSLGDISPNMILDAIRLNKPFICTKEIGIMDRVGSVGIYVDPTNLEDITNAVKKLLDPIEYERELEKIKGFNFTHTWEEITSELLSVYKLEIKN